MRRGITTIQHHAQFRLELPHTCMKILQSQMRASPKQYMSRLKDVARTCAVGHVYRKCDCTAASFTWDPLPQIKVYMSLALVQQLHSPLWQMVQQRQQQTSKVRLNRKGLLGTNPTE